jgi:SAM-dependent methyltransferase
MSRKYLNNRWCVRCGKKTPTPYIKDNFKLLPQKGVVLDIGCGNGRNSKFFKDKGYNVISVDMVNDYGHSCVLGKDKIPNYKYDIILANYIFMFLNKKERNNVFKQINNLANDNCYLVIECYPAKDSCEYNYNDFVKSFILNGWNIVKNSPSQQKTILKFQDLMLDKNL